MLGTDARGFVQFIPKGDIGNNPEFSFEGEAELITTPNQDRITIRAVEKIASSAGDFRPEDRRCLES